MKCNIHSEAQIYLLPTVSTWEPWQKFFWLTVGLRCIIPTSRELNTETQWDRKYQASTHIYIQPRRVQENQLVNNLMLSHKKWIHHKKKAMCQRFLALRLSWERLAQQLLEQSDRTTRYWTACCFKTDARRWKHIPAVVLVDQLMVEPQRSASRWWQSIN